MVQRGAGIGAEEDPQEYVEPRSLQVLVCATGSRRGWRTWIPHDLDFLQADRLSPRPQRDARGGTAVVVANRIASRRSERLVNGQLTKTHRGRARRLVAIAPSGSSSAIFAETILAMAASRLRSWAGVSKIGRGLSLRAAGLFDVGPELPGDSRAARGFSGTRPRGRGRALPRGRPLTRRLPGMRFFRGRHG